MTTINNLTAKDDISAGDLLALWSSANGDTRKLAISTLLTYMQDNLAFTFTGMPNYTTQYAAPSATGFTVAVTGTLNTHLIMSPVAAYATGSITLPIANACIDKQLLLVTCNQQVNLLTLTLNGAYNCVGKDFTASTGTVVTLAMPADGFFLLKFDLANLTWYQVG